MKTDTLEAELGISTEIDIALDSVAGILWKTCNALVKGQDNIQFTTDEEECFQISKHGQ
jgi:hypothetical protein